LRKFRAAKRVERAVTEHQGIRKAEKKGGWYEKIAHEVWFSRIV